MYPDRMRGGIAWTFALVACQPRGIDVHVVAPSDGTAVDRVTLFAGDSSMTMISISPQGRAWDAPVAAAGWQHDVPDLECGTPSTPACHFPERFLYEPYGRTTIGTLVAIGEHGGQVVAAGEIGGLVFGDGLLRVDIPLAAASPMQTTQQAIYAQAWGPDPSLGLPGCAIFSDATTRTSVAVVDLADPDCDGFPTSNTALECVPDVYMSSRGPTTLDEMTCAKHAPLTPNGEAICVLGGPQCTDGQGFATSGAGLCGDSAVCVPRTACDACTLTGKTPDGSPEELTCLEDMSVGHLFTTNTAVGRVTCTVTIDTAAVPAQICGGQQSLDIAPLVGTCNDIAIRTPAATKWDQMAVLAGNAEVSVQLATGACTVEVQVGSAVQPVTPLDAGALVALSIGSSGRGVAIPLEVTYTAGTCGASTDVVCQTTLTAADALASCLAAPVPPNTKYLGNK
jgi:hypothetical protein